MKKNLFLTFCFSILPGAGQMYQEYMKRGISLLILASLFLTLAFWIGSEVFLIGFLIVMVYSFFDSFLLRNKFIRGEEMPVDEYIFKGEKEIFGLFNKKKPLLDIMIFMIGIYLLLDDFVLGVLWNIGLDKIANVVSSIVTRMPGMIVAIISMIVGYKMIVRKEDE